jgi:hypothetical protein
MKYFKNIVSTFIAVLLLLPLHVLAQEVRRNPPVSAKCGDILEDELTANLQENAYKLTLNAGDTLNVSLVPSGEQLSTTILVTGPTNLGVSVSSGTIYSNYVYFEYPSKEPRITTGKLSANGDFTIRIVNFDSYVGNGYYPSDDTYRGNRVAGGIGVYTLYIGCTLRDGTVINPGDPLPGAQPTEQSPVPTELPTNFVGFPGLSPIDFSNAFRVSLNLNALNEGEIPATGNNVLGFKFSANAGDKMDLSFTRAAGNLNLGLVVLSSTNQVIYMAALVNAETMSSRFTLPDVGEYTIGVFKLDLLPPPIPENTSFQIQATLSQ